MAVIPERLTDFNRTDDELLELLFFSVAVAGKTAKSVAEKVNNFFAPAKRDGIKPFNYLRYLASADSDYDLTPSLMQYGVGKYTLLNAFVRSFIASGIDLKTCSAEDLEALHGVGPKTARMFLLHTRPNQRLSPLDTHVLKFIRDLGIVPDAPKATPSGKRYARIEEAFLNWIDERIRYEKHICVISRVDGRDRGCLELKRNPATGKADYAAFDLDLWNVYSGNAKNTAHAVQEIAC